MSDAVSPYLSGPVDEMTYLRTIGKRLRLLRVYADLSQQELADKAGVTRNVVSAIERGRQKPDAWRLLKLAAALDTDIGALLAPDSGEPKVSLSP